MTTFGEIVREARVGAGKSFRDLARELSATGTRVSHVHLHEVERGTRLPSPELAGALSKALWLDRRYIIECIPAKPREIRIVPRLAHLQQRGAQ